MKNQQLSSGSEIHFRPTSRMMQNKTTLFIALFSLVLLFIYCDNDRSAALDYTAMSGEELAKIHCSSCHLFPEPELLPKDIWEKGVLPQMSWRLGIPDTLVNPWAGIGYEEQRIILEANIFPSTPVLPVEAFQKIKAYYLQEAPAQPLPQPARPKVDTTLALFEPMPISLNVNGNPTVTMVQWDSLHQQILVADGYGHFFRLNPAGKIDWTFKTPSPLATVHFGKNADEYWTVIGYMNPNNLPQGLLIHRDSVERLKHVVDDLYRSVHSSFADLNADGQEDVVICEFGHYIGRLCWHEKQGDTYKRHILSTNPGAVKTQIFDWNADGHPDILALMGQGSEGLFLYENDGQGNFQQKPLLQFQPAFGSSDFELVDFNNDGQPEILYANGDNADYSYAPKAYHGVRIFQKNKDGDLEEVYFFPQYGATKALARDFDLDGDLDIAAMAFFPNYPTAPQEGFVYLENTSSEGKFAFKPATLPNAHYGHWLVQDSGDIDSDGDDDILLGSFIGVREMTAHRYQQDWERQKNQVLVLKNTTIKK